MTYRTKIPRCTSIPRLLWMILIFTILVVSPLQAESKTSDSSDSNGLRLHSLFSNNMVLQSEEEFPVWGWGEAGEKVSVEFLGKKNNAYADRHGKWILKLGPFPPGGPHEMKISGSKKTITLKNVLLGEVWVCSGQSNMEMTVDTKWGRVLNHEKEAAKANYPEIRFLQTEHTISGKPLEDIRVHKSWHACTPESVRSFSATGYFFGRAIHLKKKSPVGLVQSCWSGTPIESWTTLSSLKEIPEIREWVAFTEDTLNNLEERKKNYQQDLAGWKKAIVEMDRGIRAEPAWYDPNLPGKDWKTIELPQLWEQSELGPFDGSLWVRRTFSIPKEWASQEATVHLGAVDDQDITWLNGKKLGGKEIWYEQRDYNVPKGTLNAGENIIAVRVLDTGGPGGFSGNPGDMRVLFDTPQGKKSVPLAGKWNYRISYDISEMPPRPIEPKDYHHLPGVLYNGMIAPLEPYGIRGVIWYQGESNASRARAYRKQFPAMIRDWREGWGRGDFPFLFVQLANFGPLKNEPGEDDWAELREAQLLTLSIPHTGMAVAIDIGESGDIHPKNKQEVGRRLALAARAVAYGEKIVYSGPIYRKGSMDLENGKARLLFDHTGSGLTARGGDLKGFTISGECRKFIPAKARIEGKTVLVWSDKVSKPAAVRYGWAMNPDCSLYNREGLPASPFRTDDWERIEPSFGKN